MTGKDKGGFLMALGMVFISIAVLTILKGVSRQKKIPNLTKARMVGRFPSLFGGENRFIGKVQKSSEFWLPVVSGRAHSNDTGWLNLDEEIGR